MQSEKSPSLKLIQVEMRQLLEATKTMLQETMRLKDVYYSKGEFEKGRYEGIIIATKDCIDNLERFAIRLGVKYE